MNKFRKLTLIIYVFFLRFSSIKIDVKMYLSCQTLALKKWRDFKNSFIQIDSQIIQFFYLKHKSNSFQHVHKIVSSILQTYRDIKRNSITISIHLVFIFLLSSTSPPPLPTNARPINHLSYSLSPYSHLFWEFFFNFLFI